MITAAPVRADALDQRFVDALSDADREHDDLRLVMHPCHDIDVLTRPAADLIGVRNEDRVSRVGRLALQPRHRIAQRGKDIRIALGYQTVDISRERRAELPDVVHLNDREWGGIETNDADEIVTAELTEAPVGDFLGIEDAVFM